MKKYLLLGVATAVIGFSATNQTKAADIDVDAFLEARVAIALNKNSDMQFGIIEYGAAPAGSVDLGTDGNVAIGGAGTDLTHTGGTVAAGDVDATGDGASTVDISCETGGTLAEIGGATLTLSAVEVSLTAAAFGGGTACAGLATSVLTNDFSATANPNILMGGSVDVSGISTSGSYATNIGAGDPVTLRVTYQ